MTRKGLLLIVTLGALLFLSAIYAVFVWLDLGDVEISGHGIAAMTLGVVLSFLVGGGLMALTFYSNRHGYDDDV